MSSTLLLSAWAASALATGTPDSTLSVAWRLYDSARYSSAAAAFERALPTQSDAGSLGALAYCYLRLGEKIEARLTAEQAILRDSCAPEAMVVLGSMGIRDEQSCTVDIPLSVACIQRAVRCDSTIASGWYHLWRLAEGTTGTCTPDLANKFLARGGVPSAMVGLCRAILSTIPDGALLLESEPSVFYTLRALQVGEGLHPERPVVRPSDLEAEASTSVVRERWRTALPPERDLARWREDWLKSRAQPQPGEGPRKAPPRLTQAWIESFYRPVVVSCFSRPDQIESQGNPGPLFEVYNDRAWETNGVVAAHALASIEPGALRVLWSIRGGDIDNGDGALARARLWMSRESASLATQLETSGARSLRDSVMTWRASAGLESAPRDSLPYSPELPPMGAFTRVDSLPQVITRAAPNYPESARRQGIDGTVRLQVLVGGDGSVKDACVRESVSGLDLEAIRAVRNWKFKPAISSGKPVAVWIMVPFKFTLR